MCRVWRDWWKTRLLFDVVKPTWSRSRYITLDWANITRQYLTLGRAVHWACNSYCYLRRIASFQLCSVVLSFTFSFGRMKRSSSCDLELWPTTLTDELCAYSNCADMSSCQTTISKVIFFQSYCPTHGHTHTHTHTADRLLDTATKWFVTKYLTLSYQLHTHPIAL